MNITQTELKRAVEVYTREKPISVSLRIMDFLTFLELWIEERKKK